MKNQIQTTKSNDIRRSWHLIDVKDKVLGRSATQIAELLMGKKKPYFVRNLDCGDYVVVINAKDVAVTGKKETNKIYTRYSGYSAGLKKEKLSDVRASKPEKIIEHAVSGMLPRNRLHDRMLRRLHVFAGETHTFQDRFNQK